MWVCVCSRVEGFALLCFAVVRPEASLLWTTAFASRTLSGRVAWWGERDHRIGIGVCQGEMFVRTRDLCCIRGQARR